MKMLFEVPDDENTTKTPFGDYYDGKVDEDTYKYDE